MPDWFERTQAERGGNARAKKGKSFVSEAVKRVPNRVASKVGSTGEGLTGAEAAAKYQRDRGLSGGGGGGGGGDDGGNSGLESSGGRSAAAGKLAAVRGVAAKAEARRASSSMASGSNGPGGSGSADAAGRQWIQDVVSGSRAQVASSKAAAAAAATVDHNDVTAWRPALPAPGSNRAESSRVVESFLASNAPSGPPPSSAAGSQPYSATYNGTYTPGLRTASSARASDASGFRSAFGGMGDNFGDGGDKTAGKSYGHGSFSGYPLTTFGQSNSGSSNHNHSYNSANGMQTLQRPPPAERAEALSAASRALNSSHRSANNAKRHGSSNNVLFSSEPNPRAEATKAYPTTKPMPKQNSVRLPWETPENFAHGIAAEHSALKQSNTSGSGGGGGHDGSVPSAAGAASVASAAVRPPTSRGGFGVRGMSEAEAMAEAARQAAEASAAKERRAHLSHAFGAHVASLQQHVRDRSAEASSHLRAGQSSAKAVAEAMHKKQRGSNWGAPGVVVVGGVGGGGRPPMAPAARMSSSAARAPPSSSSSAAAFPAFTPVKRPGNAAAAATAANNRSSASRGSSGVEHFWAGEGVADLPTGTFDSRSPPQSRSSVARAPPSPPSPPFYPPAAPAAPLAPGPPPVAARPAAPVSQAALNALASAEAAQRHADAVANRQLLAAATPSPLPPGAAAKAAAEATETGAAAGAGAGSDPWAEALAAAEAAEQQQAGRSGSAAGGAVGGRATELRTTTAERVEAGFSQIRSTLAGSASQAYAKEPLPPHPSSPRPGTANHGEEEDDHWRLQGELWREQQESDLAWRQRYGQDLPPPPIDRQPSYSLPPPNPSTSLSSGAPLSLTASYPSSPPKGTLSAPRLSQSQSSSNHRGRSGSSNDVASPGAAAVAAARSKAEALSAMANVPRNIPLPPPSTATRRRLTAQAEASDPYLHTANLYGGERNGSGSPTTSNGSPRSPEKRLMLLHSADDHLSAWGDHQQNRAKWGKGISSSNNSHLPHDWIDSLEASERATREAKAATLAAERQASAGQATLAAALYAAAADAEAFALNGPGFQWKPPGSMGLSPHYDHPHGDDSYAATVAAADPGAAAGAAPTAAGAAPAGNSVAEYGGGDVHHNAQAERGIDFSASAHDDSFANQVERRPDLSRSSSSMSQPQHAIENHEESTHVSYRQGEDDMHGRSSRTGGSNSGSPPPPEGPEVHFEQQPVGEYSYHKRVQVQSHALKQQQQQQQAPSSSQRSQPRDKGSQQQQRRRTPSPHLPTPPPEPLVSNASNSYAARVGASQTPPPLPVESPEAPSSSPSPMTAEPAASAPVSSASGASVSAAAARSSQTSSSPSKWSSRRTPSSGRSSTSAARGGSENDGNNTAHSAAAEAASLAAATGALDLGDLPPLVLVPVPPLLSAMEQHDARLLALSPGGTPVSADRLPKPVDLATGANLIGRVGGSQGCTVGLDLLDVPEGLLRAFHTTDQGVRCYLLSQRHAAVTVAADGMSAVVEALATLQASHELIRVNNRTLPKGEVAALAIGDTLTLLGGCNKGLNAVVSRGGDLTYTLMVHPKVVTMREEAVRAQAQRQAHAAKVAADNATLATAAAASAAASSAAFGAEKAVREKKAAKEKEEEEEARRRAQQAIEKEDEEVEEEEAARIEEDEAAALARASRISNAVVNGGEALAAVAAAGGASGRSESVESPLRCSVSFGPSGNSTASSGGSSPQSSYHRGGNSHQATNHRHPFPPSTVGSSLTPAPAQPPSGGETQILLQIETLTELKKSAVANEEYLKAGKISAEIVAARAALAEAKAANTSAVQAAAATEVARQHAKAQLAAEEEVRIAEARAAQEAAARAQAVGDTEMMYHLSLTPAGRQILAERRRNAAAASNAAPNGNGRGENNQGSSLSGAASNSPTSPKNNGYHKSYHNERSQPLSARTAKLLEAKTAEAERAAARLDSPRHPNPVEAAAAVQATSTIAAVAAARAESAAVAAAAQAAQRAALEAEAAAEEWRLARAREDNEVSKRAAITAAGGGEGGDGATDGDGHVDDFDGASWEEERRRRLYEAEAAVEVRALVQQEYAAREARRRSPKVSHVAATNTTADLVAAVDPPSSPRAASAATTAAGAAVATGSSNGPVIDVPLYDQAPLSPPSKQLSTPTRLFERPGNARKDDEENKDMNASAARSSSDRKSPPQPFQSPSAQAAAAAAAAQANATAAAAAEAAAAAAQARTEAAERAAGDAAAAAARAAGARATAARAAAEEAAAEEAAAMVAAGRSPPGNRARAPPPSLAGSSSIPSANHNEEEEHGGEASYHQNRPASPLQEFLATFPAEKMQKFKAFGAAPPAATNATTVARPKATPATAAAVGPNAQPPYQSFSPSAFVSTAHTRSTDYVNGAANGDGAKKSHTPSKKHSTSRHQARDEDGGAAVSVADSDQLGYQRYDDLGSSCSGSALAVADNNTAVAAGATLEARGGAAVTKTRIPADAAPSAEDSYMNRSTSSHHHHHRVEAEALEALRAKNTATRRFELERDVAAAGAAEHDREILSRLEVTIILWNCCKSCTFAPFASFHFNGPDEHSVYSPLLLFAFLLSSGFGGPQERCCGGGRFRNG